MNQDGEISTVSLADSSAYFDLTGDGIKEKVGWIQATDGLVAYDKNGNGKIDGINEVFGNATTSGFEELRALADSNYDSVIDRRDELYNQLKVWQDTNQDGISQSSELKSLSAAGVKNIELNVIGTNIELNGNLLSEAGRYGDSAGDRELAADIQLTFDTRITTIDTATIPNYTEYPESKTLPNLRGFGVVMDTSIAYNLNDTLRAMGVAYAADITKVATQFDAFMAEWSGLTQQTGYQTWSVDKQRHWIYERFLGSSVNPRSPIDGVYGQLTERSKAFFAFSALYPTLQEGVEFKREINEYVVSDVLALHKNTIEFMNNPNESIEKKLFLADVMNTLEKTYLVFDPTKITPSIADPLMRELVSGIYAGTYKAHVYENGNYASGNILAVGSENGDAITINGSSGSTVLAGKGNDVIHGSTGNDVYLYRTGDGADTIIDGGGSDTLRLTDMLQSDIVLRSEGKNLIIARAEDGKAFEELSDKVTLINWADSANRIDAIRFSDGSSLDFMQVLRDYFITNTDDRLDLTSGADTIDMLEGDDVIHALGGDDTIHGNAGEDILSGDEGNDTLYGDEGNDTLIGGEGNDTLQGGMGSDTLDGGTGNDTYVYNLGDGKDIITDVTGLDTLQFGAGISVDSLIVQYLANGDMVIGLKEDNKSFDELNDTITIRGWSNAANRLENILLADGTAINLDALQIGTEGDDTLTFGDNGITIDLLGGNDTVTSGSGNDVIDGGMGNDTINAGNGANQITAGEGNDTITTLSGADTISGGSGNDTINSGAGNDTLSGNEGDDILIAGEGNDTLSGGVGNDSLQGGIGDDLYLYSRGDGKDTIIDEYRYGYNGSNQSNAGNDTLRFGEGITQDDLIAYISGDDLILALKESGKTLSELGDVITIKNWVNTANRVETIALADGTIVDLAAIQSATEGDDNLIYGDNTVSVDGLGGNDLITSGSGADALHGGAGSDTLRSSAGDDTLYGDAGSDTLIAGIGNDTLSGGEGNDTLYGESGNDTLAGNGGIDTLIGGLGNDTYRFGIGDGKDTIIDEYSYGSGGVDTLVFGEGISAENLVARAVSGSNDLVIAIRESGKGFDALSDTVTLKNWFDANKRIENFLLSDGTVITLSQMQGGSDGDDYLVFGDTDTVMDALGGNDTIITGSGNDTLEGNAGNDILISNAGNDTLSGGEGNDTLKAGDGNDTLIGGTGADTLEGGAGDDTYRFSRGDGKDRIVDTAGLDSLIFGEGIGMDDLIARVVSGSDDLQIALREDGKTFDQISDVITISGWRNAPYRIENLRLSDGTAVALTQIEGSSEGDDYLVFGDEGVIVDALGGNDTLISGDGSDTLKGGAGNDTILTSKGNDTLSGGTGTDTLKGGSGNDTYLFNRGDGSDTIFDELGTDTLSFGEGITKDDLIFKQQGNTLLIGIAEINKTFEQLSDVITITDWFKSESNIETIKFMDNSTMTQSDVAGLFVANNIYGALYSKPGAIMYGGSGDNTYVYNRGDFTVVIDDQYQQGQIDVNAGNDTLYLSGGINKGDVTFGVVGNDLILKITPKVETYEQLRDYVIIKNWANTNRGVEKVIFSNGESINIDKTTSYPTTTFNYGWVSSQYLIYGDDANTVAGTANDDTIETNGGDDTINAGSGNDRIDAGAGNDVIEGGSSNDVITMGSGNDTVTDISGNDVYKFNKGDGNDTIYDLAGTDTLIFGEGITQEDLIVKQYGSDLVIGIKDGSKSFDELSDKLTIKNWFFLNNKIENFQLFDGEILNPNELVTTTPSESKNEYAMQFDGNDTISLLSREEAMQIKNNFSFGAWIKVSTTHQIDPESSSGVEGVWNQHYAFEPAWGTVSPVSAGGFAGAGLSIGTNGISVYEHGGNFMPSTAVYSGVIGAEFNHVMVVYNNKIPSIYLNGILVDTGISSSAQNVFAPYLIGGMSYGYINGIMDDIQIYNRTLSADEVMNIKNGSVISDGLVVKYDFEGIDPYTDKSGNGHSAIVNGNPMIVRHEILNLHSLQFNGGLDQLSTTQIVSSATTGQQVTVSFEMTWDGTNSMMPIGFYQYDLWLYNGKFGFNTGQGDIYGIANNSFLAGTTHQITAVFTQGNVLTNKLYIDGIEQNLSQQLGTPANSYADITKELNISGWDQDTVYSFRGSIDNVQLHNRPLTTTEINRVVQKEVISDGLVAYYDFEGTNPYDDKSGNGHTAVLRGDPKIIWKVPPLLSETFENGATGWSNNTTTSASELTRFLGRFGGTGGNEGVSKTYDFGIANAGKQITIEFDMYEIDSWDGELFKVFLNNDLISNQLWVDGHAPYVANGDKDLGVKTTNEQFTGWGSEDIHHYSLTTQLDGYGKAKLGFGSTLDESLNNESWGIDNIKIYMESSTYSPPLILDLNANGKTSISLTDSHTYFDYGANGLKEHTAWIEKGDGLLVRDINNDGIINDGSELFGDKTKLTDGSLASDGYAALAQYDTNSDGVIDKNDADFAQLKLWKDTNQNGKTDAGELVDLSVVGVTSLSLNRADGSVYAQSTENGNIVTNETNYSTLTSTGTMRDVWFKIDATDTITDNDTVHGTADSETLSGDVGNDTYVIAYGGGADVIDDNGNGADTIKFLSSITADRLVVQWVRGTDDLHIGIRENAEDDTPITELANTLTIKNWFNESGAIEQFSFSDGTTLNRQGICDLLLDVEGDLTMRVLDAGNTLSGNSGNDVLFGLTGNELLIGKEGDDYLSGLEGDDYCQARS